MSAPSRLVGVAHWVFRNRGWLPTPWVLCALYLTKPIGILTGVGLALMVLGQSIRFWSISHMGVAARARDAQVEKLVYTGPYELTRNPLYIANICMFTGLGVATGGLTLGIIFLVFFALYFNLIVRFEEDFLERRLGEIYRSYRNRVPRWLGESAPVHAASPRVPLNERARLTVRAERTTIVILVFVTILIIFRAASVG